MFSTPSRLKITALALAGWMPLAQAQEATPDFWQVPVAASVHPELSRAAVLAEVQLWQSSGLAALARGESGQPATAPALAARTVQAQERYDEARAAPEFRALVLNIARQRGDLLLLAGR
ncbi:MAG: hypothetical protein IV093_17965 [Rubrivivax sp.]|nr:hypothetical protein [Rubrivivax sp.]